MIIQSIMFYVKYFGSINIHWSLIYLPQLYCSNTGLWSLGGSSLQVKAKSLQGKVPATDEMWCECELTLLKLTQKCTQRKPLKGKREIASCKLLVSVIYKLEIKIEFFQGQMDTLANQRWDSCLGCLSKKEAFDLSLWQPHLCQSVLWKFMVRLLILKKLSRLK